MPARKTGVYSPATRAKAVALAAEVGVSAAARAMGVSQPAVSDWRAQRQPIALTLTSHERKEVADLARAVMVQRIRDTATEVPIRFARDVRDLAVTAGILHFSEESETFSFCRDTSELHAQAPSGFRGGSGPVHGWPRLLLRAPARGGA